MRHPGGLRLTPTGEVLKERGGEALKALDCARGEGTKEPAVLRIG